MTHYTNSRQGSVITSVEFDSAAGSDFAFFHTRSSADREQAQKIIASAGLDVVAETAINGQPVFIAKGRKKEEVFAFLQQQGEQLAEPVQKKAFDFWKWKGRLSILGQSFDLLSVYLARSSHSRVPADNIAYFVYSLSNISASFVDIIFGGRKIPDVHR